MAFNNASAGSSATLLSSSILLLLFASCFTTSLANVLKSGEELSSGNSLSIYDYKFIMEKDCNLVLYDKNITLWSSNTAKMGTHCKLRLQDNGEMNIFAGTNSVLIWSSETGGAYGKYALVLQPNGNVVVYGSPLWSTGARIPKD
ncbi:mannose-specific lectin-like [Phalaenopsis equestris]|uniref:mannose-specific lectin-like n=1 Tax=Phalaenopsis equestris TaxID=78828 RepID=UPI0009E62C13|nr:mannose-specific lectin-like [Phalaenopsis equestris]